MQRTITIIIGILVLLGISWFLWSQVTNAAVGTLDIYTGTATVQSKGDERPVNVGDTVKNGEVIVVPEGSRIGVVLKDGTIIRLDGGSRAMIRGNQVELLEGGEWSRVQPTKSGFSVETPTVVATVRGTSFAVWYKKAISTVYVSRHAVDVRLRSKPKPVIVVPEGNIIRIRDDHALEDLEKGSSPLSQDEKDAWIHFNEDLDAKLDGTETSSESLSSIASSQATSSVVSSKNAASSKAAQAIASSSKAATPTPTPTLVSLTLTANPGTIDLSEISQLKVKGTDSAGHYTDETKNVTWDINPTSLGTIDNSARFHPKAEGSVRIIARLGTLTSNAVNIRITAQATTTGGSTGGTTTTTPPPAQKASLRVSCTKIQGPQGAPTTAQCAATYIDDQGTSSDVTGNTTWSVTGTAKGVIDKSGYYAAGAPRGQDIVTGAYGGLTATATIDVP